VCVCLVGVCVCVCCVWCVGVWSVCVCMCVCVCKVSALTHPINLVEHIMVTIISLYSGGLASDPGNEMRCFCPRASIKKLRQCFKIEITNSLFCYVSFWDFHRGGIFKLNFVLNEVASLVWRFQTFRKHENFPKYLATFVDRPSALPQVNGIFNHHLLQPPIFSSHSAVPQTNMKLAINKLIVWIISVFYSNCSKVHTIHVLLIV